MYMYMYICSIYLRSGKLSYTYFNGNKPIYMYIYTGEYDAH